MKKIIVNGRFLIHRVTGVERYASELLKALDKIVEPKQIELAVPPEVSVLPKFKNILVRRIGKLHNRLWEHISFPIYVKKKGAVSLNLCNVAPLLNPGIVCLFDAKIKAHPEFFSLRFLLWYNLLYANAIKRAKFIITDSENAKEELLKYYPSLKPEKVKVIYPAWQHYRNIRYDNNVLAKYNLENNGFFFAMGSMEPNKNFKWIAEVAHLNLQYKFVIAGAINEKVFAEGMGFECPSNMKLLGYISDEEAKTLMKECKAFLFPTFYEGFGLPPLEAISAGAKKVIVSDTAVMHEIFNGNVIYIDPYKISLNIEEVLSKEIDTENSVLNKFGWDKSALKLKQELEENI